MVALFKPQILEASASHSAQTHGLGLRVLDMSTRNPEALLNVNDFQSLFHPPVKVWAPRVALEFSQSGGFTKRAQGVTLGQGLGFCEDPKPLNSHPLNATFPPAPVLRITSSAQEVVIIVSATILQNAQRLFGR